MTAMRSILCTLRVTLHPGRAYLDEQIRLENPTDGMHPYYFWNCTAFPCRAGTRFIYPMTLGTDHNGVKFFNWPVDDGKDLSWLKNYETWASIFAVNCAFDFFGAYDVGQFKMQAELGGGFYLAQLNKGLMITGLSRDVSWGFYIAQFTFLVGVAAAAVVPEPTKGSRTPRCSLNEMAASARSLLRQPLVSPISTCSGLKIVSGFGFTTRPLRSAEAS